MKMFFREALKKSFLGIIPKLADPPPLIVPVMFHKTFSERLYLQIFMVLF